MTVNTKRAFNDVEVDAQTASIGATPAAGFGIVPAAGYIQRVMAGAHGTTTGTITVTVTINGGSDIAAGALTIAAGTGIRPGTIIEFPMTGPNAIFVNEGDCITFTPSGGGGAAIGGAFAAIVRAI
jgi:hypothetical protein